MANITSVTVTIPAIFRTSGFIMRTGLAVVPQMSWSISLTTRTRIFTNILRVQFPSALTADHTVLCPRHNHPTFTTNKTSGQCVSHPFVLISSSISLPFWSNTLLFLRDALCIFTRIIFNSCRK